jgi:TonB-dependent SusC/RagA subfamily outer membrane receptor
MRLFCCVVAFAAFSASAAAQAQAPAQTARDSVARPNLTSVEITADSGRSGSVRLEVTPIVSSSPVQTIGDLLSGRVAGIDVLPAGATGQGPRVRLRGMASARFTNDPLMVIDGLRLTGSTATALADLPPEEVETIEVLKGPSATALYGTDGANGVIVVTTKRANVGGFRWNAFSENGIATDPNKGNYEDLWIAFDRTKRDATGTAPTCSLQALGRRQRSKRQLCDASDSAAPLLHSAAQPRVLTRWLISPIHIESRRADRRAPRCATE